jgi:hypothetical protein
MFLVDYFKQWQVPRLTLEHFFAANLIMENKVKEFQKMDMTVLLAVGARSQVKLFLKTSMYKIQSKGEPLSYKNW